MTAGGRREQRQRGAASLLVASCLALLLTVGAALGVVASLLRTHRSAQATADLAALAGAAAGQQGEDGCLSAARLATANGARLTGCRWEAEDVVVTVLVTGPRWLGQEGDLEARARAGPASRGAGS